jgi:hypothetical protein
VQRPLQDEVIEYPLKRPLPLICFELPIDALYEYPYVQQIPSHVIVIFIHVTSIFPYVCL